MKERMMQVVRVCWGGGGEGRDIEMWNVVCLTSVMDGRSVSAGLVDLLNDLHRCIRSGVCTCLEGFPSHSLMQVRVHTHRRNCAERQKKTINILTEHTSCQTDVPDMIEQQSKNKNFIN